MEWSTSIQHHWFIKLLHTHCCNLFLLLAQRSVLIAICSPLLFVILFVFTKNVVLLGWFLLCHLNTALYVSMSRLTLSSDYFIRYHSSSFSQFFNSVFSSGNPCGFSGISMNTWSWLIQEFCWGLSLFHWKEFSACPQITFHVFRISWLLHHIFQIDGWQTLVPIGPWSVIAWLLCNMKNLHNPWIFPIGLRDIPDFIKLFTKLVSQSWWMLQKSLCIISCSPNSVVRQILWQKDHWLHTLTPTNRQKFTRLTMIL